MRCCSFSFSLTVFPVALLDRPPPAEGVVVLTGDDTDLTVPAPFGCNTPASSASSSFGFLPPRLAAPFVLLEADPDAVGPVPLLWFAVEEVARCDTGGRA